MKKLLIIAFVLWGGFLAVVFSGHSQNEFERREIQVARGVVSSTDWVGSILVVNTGGDEITLTVPDNTIILKGGRRISFAEVNQNDNVTVEFYDDHFAGLKVISITINLQGVGAP